MEKAGQIKIATVCSGIGSPEQALKELGIDHEISFACEIDKYARQTYLANFTPTQMYTDLTAEEWVKPEQYADLFIGGIPCQAFSLAGKRLGELDKRGLLFYDFYRYVKNQQPKVFIIENVKGLLSDNNGVTFQNWCALLGRSMNTHINMFNHDDSLLYNLHFKVLNSKDFGVPQNRERVFLIGIRNDLPNTFRFPIGERLKIRLKDILESEVDEKYYLSEKMINYNLKHKQIHQERGNGFAFEPIEVKDDSIVSCISTKYGSRQTDTYLKVKEATKQGYAIAKEGDSINLSNPNSETRRGRVGNQIANTLDTACNQGVVVGPVLKLEHIVSGGKWDNTHNCCRMVYSSDGISPCVTAMGGGNQEPKTVINNRIRRLTPLECMRLQGYPDTFIKPCSDSQTYKQAGNSITVNVMKAIINNLIPILC
jgi:DNA (cytosine-5)-methyltransferase 1